MEPLWQISEVDAEATGSGQKGASRGLHPAREISTFRWTEPTRALT
jgi:hypothetical protein